MSMNVLLSGLIAAIISGGISFCGNRQSIKAQKEIAKMQQKEHLFYEHQLERSDEIRHEIAKFVQACIDLGHLAEQIEQIADQDVKVGNFEKVKFEQQKLTELNKRLSNVAGSVHEQITLIRLYLFHNEDPRERGILHQILLVEQALQKEMKIPYPLLEVLVDVTREYLDNQDKTLQAKAQ